MKDIIEFIAFFIAAIVFLFITLTIIAFAVKYVGWLLEML